MTKNIEIEIEILECLLSSPTYMSLLVSDSFENIFNKKRLFNPIAMAIEVNQLISKGLICAEYNGKYLKIIKDESVDEVVLHLTEKGGNFYEENVYIDWENLIFTEIESFEENRMKCVVETNNYQILSDITYKLLNLNCNLNVMLKVTHSWKPVAWKMMPIGYVMVFHDLNNIPDDMFSEWKTL